MSAGMCLSICFCLEAEMANSGVFTGRLAEAVELRHHGEVTVASFTLIRNEYAGEDDGGERRERQVAIRFTAFGPRAKAISEHMRKGDQMVVTYGIENSKPYERDGVTIYGHTFKVKEFEFGAPGSEKREMLANRAAG